MANNLITNDLSSLIQVSRETIEGLNEFKRILLENNKKFNLISSKDEEIIDARHIQDSAQKFYTQNLRMKLLKFN